MMQNGNAFLQTYDRLLLLKLGLPFRQCDLGLRYKGNQNHLFLLGGGVFNTEVVMKLFADLAQKKHRISRGHYQVSGEQSQ